MVQDIFGEIGEKLNEMPREIGTEAVGQFKGTNPTAIFKWFVWNFRVDSRSN